MQQVPFHPRSFDSDEDDADEEDLFSRLQKIRQPGTDVDDAVRRLQGDIMDAEPHEWYTCVEELYKWGRGATDLSCSMETFLLFFPCKGNLTKACSRLLETIDKTSQVKKVNRIVLKIARLLIEKNDSVILQQNKQGETALHRCARKNNIDVMRLLIQNLKDIGRLGKALGQIQNKGWTPLQLTISFGHVECMELLINEDQAFTASFPANFSILSFTLESDRPDLFLTVLKRRPGLIFGDFRALVLVVKKDARKAWEEATDLLRSSNPDQPLHPESGVLRVAVQALNDFMVAEIVALQPSLAVKEWEENGEKSSMLDLIARAKADTDEIKAKKEIIRQLLLPAFVNTYDIGTLKQKFRKANDKSLSLVLKPFGESNNQGFFEFTRLLCGEKGKSPREVWIKRKFETTLRLVRLPDLHEIAKQSAWQQRYWETSQELQKKHSDAVTKIFSWLKKEKKVTSIYKVIVKDSFEFPIPEHAIEKALDGLKVQFLDWKRPDISVDTLEAVGNDTIRKLHLYSSGNRAVLRHWFGLEGIRKLPNLEEVWLTICTQNLDEELEEKISHLVQDARAQLLSEVKGESLKIHDPKFEKWDSKTPSFYKRQMEGRNIIRHQISYPSYDVFRQQYLDFFAANQGLIPTVRVAIIDNGVDEYALGKEVEYGCSFIDHGDDDESDYGIVSHPHGTQMAICVHHFNPCCEIYVAKVGTGKGDFTAERVKDAISWAIQNEVDVISLSVTFNETSSGLQALKDAISEAADKNHILVFYSTSNVDTSLAEYSSLGCHGAFSVGTPDLHHAKDQLPQHKRPDYIIKSPTVTMRDIPYRDFEPRSLVADGTSVATSLLAGFASMVLTCGKFVNGAELSERQTFVKSRLSATDGIISLANRKIECGEEVPKKFEQPSDFKNFMDKYFRGKSA